MDKALSELMSCFLIGLRDSAKLSQQDVANRSNFFGGSCILDQRAVSRLEKEPLGAVAINVAAYMRALGSDENEFYKKLNQLSSQLGNSSMENKLQISNTLPIANKIESALSRILKASKILKSSNEPYLKELDLVQKLESSINTLKGLYRKPVIGIFGHYDVGKTTILNTVLGDRILPESYQPATCVVNLIVHEDDRPDHLNGSKVAIFRKDFLPHMIKEPSLVNKYLIEKGDYSLLEKLGVHDYDDGPTNEAYIAIVFTTAPILKEIWLLDTPGNLNEDETGDTEKALAGVELIDGMLFVSQFTGFLNSKDFAFFAQIARHREPVTPDAQLEHIAIVASHCHSSIIKTDIEKAKKNAFKRLSKQMREFIFLPWQEDGKVNQLPTASDLEARTFPFWRETPEYRDNLLNEIVTMASHLSENHDLLISNAIERLDDHLLKEFTHAQNSLQNKKTHYEERVKILEEQEQNFQIESAEINASLKKLISSCSSRKQDDLERILNFYNANMSTEGLTDLIKDNFDDKKEAAKSIGAMVGQKLNTIIEKTLKSSGENFGKELDLLLTSWQKAMPEMSKVVVDENLEVSRVNSINLSSFDARSAFIGGMTGLTSLGAMSLYVSTFISSNLGAYIVVAQVAGWLTTLGITSSVTATTSFVAAIGGPITIGLMLAGVIGYGVFRLIGRDWQTTLAKKLRTQLDKNGTKSKLEAPVIKYWDNTETATTKGVEGLIKSTEIHIDTMREEARKEYDGDLLDNCIDLIDEVKSVFIKSSIVRKKLS